MSTEPIIIGVMRGSSIPREMFEILRDMDNIKVVVLDKPDALDKSMSFVDWDNINESIAIQERIHIIRDKFINDVSKIGILAKRQRELLNDNYGFISLFEAREMYDEFPKPILVKPNNKPWYQDRKLNRSKKSRRTA